MRVLSATYIQTPICLEKCGVYPLSPLDDVDVPRANTTRDVLLRALLDVWLMAGGDDHFHRPAGVELVTTHEDEGDDREWREVWVLSFIDEGNAFPHSRDEVA